MSRLHAERLEGQNQTEGSTTFLWRNDTPAAPHVGQVVVCPAAVSDSTSRDAKVLYTNMYAHKRLQVRSMDMHTPGQFHGRVLVQVSATPLVRMLA